MADLITESLESLAGAVPEASNPRFQAFVRALHSKEASGTFTTPEGGIIYGQKIKSGSHKGQRAMGPLQVMPATFAGIKRNTGLPLDPHVNEDLTKAGILYAAEAWRASKGNPVKAGAYYYGGPAALKREAKDVTSGGQTTTQYGRDIAQLMGTTGVPAAAQEPDPAALPITPDDSFAVAVIGAKEGTSPGALASYNPEVYQRVPRNADWTTALQTHNGNALAAVAQSATEGLALIEAEQRQADQQAAVEEAQRKAQAVQETRLAKAFGDGLPSLNATRLPGAVDRYVNSLLDN